MVMVTSGLKKKYKETWWWSKEVWSSIFAKKKAKKMWDRKENKVRRKPHKQACRKAKNDVAKAKEQFYEELNGKIDTKNGEKFLYHLVKQVEKAGREIHMTKVIIDEAVEC